MKKTKLKLEKQFQQNKVQKEDRIEVASNKSSSSKNSTRTSTLKKSAKVAKLRQMVGPQGLVSQPNNTIRSQPMHKIKGSGPHEVYYREPTDVYHMVRFQPVTKMIAPQQRVGDQAAPPIKQQDYLKINQQAIFHKLSSLQSIESLECDEESNCDSEFINWIIENQILPLAQQTTFDFAEEVLLQGLCELQVKRTRGIDPIVANDQCTL